MTIKRTFDRIPKFDARSLDFPITGIMRSQQQMPSRASRVWGITEYFDQGTEGACTGFAVAHEAACHPVKVGGVNADIAYQVYRRAQQLDQWPGEDYDGSSVLAAMKAATELGWYSEYRWAFGVAELKQTILNYGPAVLGTFWYSGMFNTDRDGWIHAQGEVMGGHAYLCKGYLGARDAFVIHNSWGPQWGKSGCALISYSDMDRLLKNQGECAVPVIRNR